MRKILRQSAINSLDEFANKLITLKVRVIVKSYFEFAPHHFLSDSVFKFFPAPVEEGTDTIIVDQLGGGDGKLKTNVSTTSLVRPQPVWS